MYSPIQLCHNYGLLVDNITQNHISCLSNIDVYCSTRSSTRWLTSELKWLQLCLYYKKTDAEKLEQRKLYVNLEHDVIFNHELSSIDTIPNDAQSVYYQPYRNVITQINAVRHMDIIARLFVCLST